MYICNRNHSRVESLVLQYDAYTCTYLYIYIYMYMNA